MKRNIFKIAILFVLTLILAIISVPSFDLKVAGKQVKFDEINLGFIGINSTIPSLRPGKEIYPSTKYYGEISFVETDTEEQKEEMYKYILDSIQKRIDYANLYDITVSGEKKNNGYFITLEIPNSYPNSKLYADWLVNSAKLEVLKITPSESEDENAQPDISSISLKDYQIKTIEKGNNIFLQIDTTQKRAITIPHLIFSFESDANQLFGGLPTFSAEYYQSGYAPVRMFIGNQAYGIYLHESNTNAIRAIPTGNGDMSSSRDVDNFLNISRSYFRETTEFEREITLNENTEFIKAEISRDGSAFIAVTFVFSLALIMLLALRTFGLKTGAAISIVLIATNLFTFTLLKFLQAQISTGLVLGFILIILIAAYTLFEIFKNGVKDIEIRDYSYFLLISLISLLALNVLSLNLGLVNDLLLVISTGSFGLILAIQIYLRLVIQILKLDK